MSLRAAQVRVRYTLDRPGERCNLESNMKRRGFDVLLEANLKQPVKGI